MASPAPGSATAGSARAVAVRPAHPRAGTALAVWTLILAAFCPAGPFNAQARWFDPERGRWMSEEPLRLDGPNLYHFGFNDPVNGYDPDGLKFRVHGGTEKQKANVRRSLRKIRRNLNRISDPQIRRSFKCHYDSTDDFDIYLRPYIEWLGATGMATPFFDEAYFDPAQADNLVDFGRTFIHEYGHNVYGFHTWWHDNPSLMAPDMSNVEWAQYEVQQILK